MMKSFCLALAVAVLLCGTAAARKVNALSYREMWEQAEIIVIATVTGIEEVEYDFAADKYWKTFLTYGEPGERVLKELVAEKVSFRIDQQLKGDKPDTAALLNFRFNREPDIFRTDGISPR